jgi:glucose/arabinose dehydrogenase
MTQHWFFRVRPDKSPPSKRQPIHWRPKVELLEKREVPTTFPPGFTESNIASGISSPTAMEFAPDGRIFVAQQTGQLRVIKNGSLLPTPFVSVTTTSSGERGLLGVTFDPNFAANGYVYVFYTVPTAPIHNRVSRFTADPGNPDVALPGSEFVVLELSTLGGATNHNGGAIHFGLDGKLYVAAGENATPQFAQAPRNTHGKILRVNADSSIPPDNPFANSNRARKEIWAMGFRNPFTFAVQPGTGRIYVNDVGSSGGGRREEVNNLVKFGNYGWPFNEGYTTDPAYQSPVFAYTPTYNGSNCAVVGGVFFNPPVNPYPAEYYGKYFFADLCGNWISRLDPDAGVPANTVTTFATGISNTTPVDMKVGTDNHLYYVIIGGGGVVRRINYTPPAPDSGPANSDVVTLVTARPSQTNLTRPPIVLPIADGDIPRPQPRSSENDGIDAEFVVTEATFSTSTPVLNRPSQSWDLELTDPIADELT